MFNWLKELLGLTDEPKNDVSREIKKDLDDLDKNLYRSLKEKGGISMGKEVKIEATVAEVKRSKIIFEFGRTQGNLWISGSGVTARKLKLKPGDKVLVSVKTLGK